MFTFIYINTPRIQAYVKPKNGVSKHVLKKLGFHEESLFIII